MNRLELVLVPGPVRGHLVSMGEFANELLSRDDRFSVTILILNSPYELDSPPPPLPTSSQPHIKYLQVPKPLQLPPPELLQESPPYKYARLYIASQKTQVKDIIVNRSSKTTSFRLSGLVVDMFCTAMNDVAAELGVPSFLFFSSGAAFLGFTLYLNARLELGGALFEESDPDSDIPSYANPVPTKVLPSFAFKRKGENSPLVSEAGRFKKTKGIIVNTVLEFESHAVASLSDGVTPTVYTLGPLLDLDGKHKQWSESDQNQRDKIMTWLDDQPSKSVVFLCFGSFGAFCEPQLRQIANGLEHSGQRFLWSVRKAPPQGKFKPEIYTDPEEFLPRGFSERTKEQGMICGSAPQVEVLAHRAIGGFVSHCGWNSILESLWFGVPIATWPIYAEQHINAFQMVRDLGLAVELRLDYKKDRGDLVTTEEIGRAVGCVMDGGDGVRKRVEEMSEKCRRAVLEGGSSFKSLGHFIEAVSANVA